MSNMSKDRVRFVIPHCELDKRKLQEVAEETLSISQSDILAAKSRYEGLTIICRPSQFARFLIARNEAGLPNGFKCLEPVLFVPVPENNPIDVSKRPNKFVPEQQQAS